LTEVAERLGIGRTTVYQEVVDGNLKAKRFGKKNIRIPAEELRRSVQRNRPDVGDTIERLVDLLAERIAATLVERLVPPLAAEVGRLLTEKLEDLPRLNLRRRAEK
jgi:excisionase family DNA binding protein